MHRSTRVFVALACSKVFVAGTNFAILILLGRLLGTTGLGRSALIVAAGAFLHTSLISWTHSAIVRFGCEEWETVGTLSQTLCTRLPLVLFSAGTAIVLLVIQPFHWLARGYGLDPLLWELVGLYAACLWIEAETEALLQAVGRIGLQAVLASIAGALSLLLISLAVAFGEREPGKLVLVLSLTNATIWGAAWVATVIRSRGMWQWPLRDNVRRQFLYGAPLFIAFGFGYASDWGDHLLLGRLVSTDAVGQFGLAYQIFLMLIAAAGMLNTITLPQLIASHIRSREAARNYVARVVPTVFVLWVICSLAVVATIPPVIAAFAGPNLIAAILPLVVLCTVVPSHVLTSLYSVLFSVQERLGRLLLYQGVMAALNVVLSLSLIPRFGVAGAAAGTIVSYVFAEAAYALDQHRYLGISPGGLIAVWVTTLLFGLVQAGLGTHIGLRFVWSLVAVLGVVWIARRTAAIDGDLIDRLCMGRLSPLSTMLQRVLITKSMRLDCGAEPDASVAVPLSGRLR